jgi:hypothetical protein
MLLNTWKLLEKIMQDHDRIDAVDAKRIREIKSVDSWLCYNEASGGRRSGWFRANVRWDSWW